MTVEKKIIQEDEIDLVELVKTIWSGRLFIAKVTGIFIVLGLVIAFTSPVEYEASTRLLPEVADNGSQNLGGLGSLAGLAGIDLGRMPTGGAVLSPQIYPEIVNSLPFILDVMSDTIYFESQDLRTSSFDYFEKHAKSSLLSYAKKYSIGLLGIIYSGKTSESNSHIFYDQEFYRLSKKQRKLVEGFKERISINISDETGLINIMVEMPDAFAAAQVTRKIEREVTKSVIKYKTDKAKENLAFVVKTFEEAKKNFESVQFRLARLMDRNMNVSSATAQIQLKRVENEYNLAFEVYKGLASQVEQAKIKLKEETPVFTVLDPVRIPAEKSKPKRVFVLVVFFVLGSFSSVSICIAKKLYLSKIK
ncbi:Wzz/FepE/Etk N-terminal domain-containing protein [Reichenbachiella ulvae]|uniref:Wzz/FepE/Etk N-terminal domain-containing protein n=1 Tax=Reichenbachiella ulvae TaxID=2980104 RepID=A0ABT3CZ44_9BACT|nr:Wzz/FepE/Etk N-terminal domain-containing protein [Reichenbachiella ulvae]MCV9388483.1 Wzz/FepE/Etk N-terminal domain-containing protein [Reichenbachiella ulvae]